MNWTTILKFGILYDAQEFLRIYSGLSIGKEVDLGKISRLKDEYHSTGAPIAELSEMTQRGFEFLFDAKERGRIPIGPLVFLGGLFLIQAVAGTILMCTSVGAPFGAALISESLNELFAIRDVLYNR